MTTYVETFINCSQCRGTGMRPPNGIGGEPCIYCSGTGKLPRGHMDITDIVDKLSDISDKCDDIFEKVSE